MIFGSIAVLTGLMVLASLVSLFKHEAWWIRVFDFPRLQLTVFAGLLLVAQLVLLSFGNIWAWLLIVLTLASLLFQGWWIIPYTRLFPKEVKRAVQANPENRLRILSANVLTSNRQADGLLAMVKERQPDIVVAVEPDDWWQAQLDALEPDYPYTQKCPLDNLYGMLLYSRLPLHDTAIQYLVEDAVPSMHVLVELRSGRRVQLHCIHPAPPSPTENYASTERDAELVIVGRTAAAATYPVIVTGDLNDVAWSATTRLFRKVSGLLDPRVGRGMFNTFNAFYRLLRWPLDHLFHSDHFTLVSIERLGAFGSDHFPILVELALEPRRGAEQEGLESDPEDRQWARDKADAENAGSGDVHRPGE